ncbi:DUF2062 domain-containing protein [Natronococcus sp. A-GB7]|uniref:DUF2062 domain-containing protein n=1 Tax=Natronococcus sp. A-GB7 TaxID=3037649 RepID=UPI00241D2F1D|nr:DUF2062 domain-containing protein [Natronococcus sp. A-GB7]MDG5817308.1 DUF2062 domain-containing protein [Natronococcus sp. A-GB7]
MIRERLSRYRERVRRELTTALQEEHTPHEVGLSFAVGIFVTAMPTGGLGIGLLAGLAAWRSWVSKPAIVAAIAVLNPLVKPAVYVGSYQVGGLIFGERPLRSSTTDASLLETAGIVVRQLLVGNLLIAAVLSVSSYVVVARLTRLHRERADDPADRSSASAVLGLFRR